MAGYVGLFIVIIGALVMLLDQGKDVRKHVEGVQDLRVDVQAVRREAKEFDKVLDERMTVIASRQEKLEKQAAEIEQDVASVHEHLAKVRKEQARFRNTIAPRQINPKLKAAYSGEPVRVELVERKKQFEKVKKQIQGLSK